MYGRLDNAGIVILNQHLEVRCVRFVNSEVNPEKCQKNNLSGDRAFRRQSQGGPSINARIVANPLIERQ